MAICPSCGTENPDVAKFCMSCATPLAPSQPVARTPQRRDEERRARHARLRRHRRLDEPRRVARPGGRARAARAVLRPPRARARAARRHASRSTSATRSSRMFGVPVAHEDDPERAVRAGARDPRRDRRAERGGPEPRAPGARRHHDRRGDRRARRTDRARARASPGATSSTPPRGIQSAAPVNGLLVDERTYRASRGAIEYDEAEPVTAKGKAEPVRVWEAIGVQERHPRRDCRRHELRRPRGGAREAPRRSGTASRRRASRRSPSSRRTRASARARLLSELAIARPRARAFAGAAACPYGEGITYWPIVQIVRDAAGIVEGDRSTRVSSKLDTLLDALPLDDPDQLRTIASTVVEPARRPDDAARLVHDDRHLPGRAALGHPPGVRAAGDELAALARPRGPALGGADVRSSSSSCSASCEGPMLVVASTRPELADTHPHLLVEQDGRTVIALDALERGRQRGAALGARRAAGGAGPARRRSSSGSLRNANGNPLFLEETGPHARRRGRARRQAGSSRCPFRRACTGWSAARLDGLPRGRAPARPACVGRRGELLVGSRRASWTTGPSRRTT